MKKFFTNPEIEVIKFVNEDIVTTSTEWDDWGLNDDANGLLDLNA